MVISFVSLSLLILFFLFNRCAGAGHLRDDILHYRKELEKCPDGDDEHRSYIMDMGIKALRSVKFQEVFVFFSVAMAM